MIAFEGPVEVHLIHAARVTVGGEDRDSRCFTGELVDWSAIGVVMRSPGDGLVFFPWANVSHVCEWRAVPAVPRGMRIADGAGRVDWDAAADLVERASGWSE